MAAGMQMAQAQKVVLHPTGKDPIEYDVSELDSITFVDKESNNEVKMVVLNVFNDTEDADLMVLCDDGSYILCDGQNDEGYAVLYTGRTAAAVRRKRMFRFMGKSFLWWSGKFHAAGRKTYAPRESRRTWKK